jgi:hypothetical protein
LELLSNFAPFLQAIKASLSGKVSKKAPLKYVRIISAPMIRTVSTLKSIIQMCGELQCIECRELLLNITHFDDEDVEDMFEETVEKLEVFRLLFYNKISVEKGLKCLISKCPSLRMVGDLKMWMVSERTFFTLNRQLRFHNFRIAVEYDGVIHYSDTAGEGIAR